MTMITKGLAAVSAAAVPSMDAFGPERAGDRLAGSKRARLEQSGPSFANPARNADSSTTPVFFSDRSDHDDETNRATERQPRGGPCP